MAQTRDKTQTDPVSESYARALFELADEKQSLDDTADELKQLVGLVEANGDLADLFAHQTIAWDRRAATIQKVFGGKISPIMLNFLLVLNRKGRLGLLGTIGSAFDRLVKDKRGQVDVEVHTARPLDSGQLAEVASHVTTKIGKKAIVQQQVVPGLIGGLRLRIGDRLIDASVAAQLRRLARRIEIAGPDKVQARSAQILQEA